MRLFCAVLAVFLLSSPRRAQAFLSWPVTSSTTTSTSQRAAVTTTVPDESRRNLFAAGTLVAAGGVSLVSLAQYNTAQSSVTRALEVLQDSCDRRFLHAVVASNYCLLYQGFSTAQPSIGIRYGGSMMDGSNSGLSLRQQQELQQGEQLLADRFSSRLSWEVAIADPTVAANTMGPHVCSVWPLSSSSTGDSSSDSAVHYAWPPEGTRLQNEGSVIVDGVDCGRQSLEDALEHSKEIWIHCERYLVVPAFLEEELLRRLNGAYLI